MPTLVCEKNGPCSVVYCEGETYVLGYRPCMEGEVCPYYTPTVSSSLLKLASKVDHRSEFPEIWNQGAVSSCTAQTLGALVYKWKQIPISRMHLYYCSRAMGRDALMEEDRGCTMLDALSALQTYGYCNERYYPYDVKRLDVFPPLVSFVEAQKQPTFQFARLKQTLPNLKNCLSEGLCFAIGIMVYESFFTKEVRTTGKVLVPDMNKENMLGGHAITVCGYDDSIQCFIFRNSWGSQWGDKGYGFIPYNYLTNTSLALDAFVIFLKD